MVKRKIKRSLPLFLALVILISCLPVIPAAASSQGNRFWGAFDFSDGFTFFGDFELSCSGFIYSDGTKIEFDFLRGWVDGEPSLTIGYSEDFFINYEGDGNFDGIIYLDLTPVLSGNALTFFKNAKTISYTLTFDLAGGSWSDGSSSASHTGTYLDEVGSISSPVKFGYTFSGWNLSGSGIFDGDDNTFIFGTGNATLTAIWTKADYPSDYFTYINIDGKSYSFIGSTSSSPDVTVSLSDSSISFDWSGGENSIPAPSDFLGLSETSGGQVLYSVGDTFTLDGKTGYDSYYTFFTSVPNFYSDVIIDGHTYRFYGGESKPEVLLQVNENGATLSGGSNSYTYSFSGSGAFQGLSRVSDGSSITYPVGYSGTLDSGTTKLYSVSSSGDIYTSIITIADDQFVFSSATQQPEVIVLVSDIGATLTFNGEQRVYVYSGDGSFLGLSFQSTGDPQFVPGESFTLTGSEYTLFPISDASLPDQFTTTVNIYNNAGTQLLYSFKASAADASPRVTVAPSASTITFTVPDHDPVVFSGVYSSFTGLALKPQAISPVVVFGQTLSIGGTPFDSVLDLYCTYESGFADPSDADFVGWLATAVGGFLNFELWPGMSLDQVLWVILVIGILMWFLKVIM